MATKQQLIEALKDIITPLEKGWKVDDMDNRIQHARQLLESEKPITPKAKEIECKPIADNLFLWVYKDGREIKASFEHREDRYKKIVNAYRRAAWTNRAGGIDPINII